METDFDLIVIGSGPGGEGAALQAAKSGKSVAIVERHALVGGGSVHWNTIPSKTLRQAIHTLSEARSSPLLRDALSGLRIGYPDLLHHAETVIRQQVNLRNDFYGRNDIERIHGHARFVDEHQVAVDSPDVADRTLSAKAFVVATGSRPYHPPDIDFTHPRVRDSSSVLRLERTPRSITIYGAGVIGCEYASIFRNLGVKVNLINTRDRLLAFLDDEIVDALAYHLRDQGVLIRHNEEHERVEADEDGVTLFLKSGKQLRTDLLLWANGRAGNSNRMGLEEIGIKTDHRGNIVVDENYRSSVAHIYAVGDIVGFPSLSSASYDQGRFAAAHFAHGIDDKRLVENIPTGIYTSPEISSVGRTERELTDDKVPYEVGHAMFRSLARAQITGNTVGMLKILFHRQTLEILGIHCFGYQASEIIHIGQAIMAQTGSANSLRYFADTTFNYPTMAEAYRVAALNGLNRVL